MILLDASVSMISVSSIVVLGVMSLLGYLLRDSFQSLKKKQETTENNLNIERNERKESDRVIEGKISDLHINILTSLDDIKDQFYELRK